MHVHVVSTLIGLVVGVSSRNKVGEAPSTVRLVAGSILNGGGIGKSRRGRSAVSGRSEHSEAGHFSAFYFHQRATALSEFPMPLLFLLFWYQVSEKCRVNQKLLVSYSRWTNRYVFSCL
ncbi:hypothetical protein B0H13DRAFT_2008341 [Mycena leptocephala]|nr:hypothetical protein B0H13DRAFT_2008341 [Mycena leptocephala]